MNNHPCSGIILTGGKSGRTTDGRAAEMEVGGQRVLDRLLSVMRPLVDDIILVAEEPLSYIAWNVLVVTGHFGRHNAMDRIHAGLFAARNPHALVVTCNMPLVQPALLRGLLEAAEPHLDVIVPKTSTGSEPLTAIYSKRCLKPMEASLVKKQDSIMEALRQSRQNPIEEQELRRYDRELISFTDINSPKGASRAEDWLRRHACANE